MHDGVTSNKNIVNLFDGVTGILLIRSLATFIMT